MITQKKKEGTSIINEPNIKKEKKFKGKMESIHVNYTVRVRSS